MITPIAKLSLKLSRIYLDIDPANEFPILSEAKNRGLRAAGENNIDDLAEPISWFSVGLAETNRESPQEVADMIWSILGWRLYQNIHDRNRWAWGCPPAHLGGDGSGWSWKSEKEDWEKILKAMIGQNL